MKEKTTFKLTISVSNGVDSGTVIDVIDNVGDYNLSKSFGRSCFGDDVKSILKLADHLYPNSVNRTFP